MDYPFAILYIENFTLYGKVLIFYFPAYIGWESPKELERVKHVLQGPSMYVYMRPVLLSLSHLMYA